jgi:multiple sugar transport system permease protein
MATTQKTYVASQPAETEAIAVPQSSQFLRVTSRADRLASSVFIMPSVLVVLLLAIFPLLVSLYLSLSHFKFVKGGFEIKFVGLANYQKLFLGLEKSHFLGVFAIPSLVGWMVLASVIGLLIYALFRGFIGRRFKARSLVGNILVFVFITALMWTIMSTLGPGGRPGTLVVTLLYVYIDIFFQYTLGLGLALLVTQHIPGRRFFRVIFLIPMMITPVGIAYMFRMLVDTDKGPFQPIWQAMGLGLFSWVNNPWGARAAVMLGDIWQWTPFMFIVLLAAIEGQSMELLEAARVDGANRWQAFWHITFPQILPVSTTLILIRMIEAFKIVDLPNVLTNGGPGTATESLTLQSFIAWRSLDLGTSAAIAYTLLFLVTFIGMAYINLIRRRVTGEI